MDSSRLNLGVGVLLVLTFLHLRPVLPCVSKAGWGWGQGQPAGHFSFLEPTLIPKLKAAFYEGKASVAWKQHGDEGHGLGWSDFASNPSQAGQGAVPVSYGHNHNNPSKGGPLVINGLGWDAKLSHNNVRSAPPAHNNYEGRYYQRGESEWTKVPPVKKSIKRRRHKPKPRQAPPKHPRGKGGPRPFPLPADFPFH